MDTIRLRDLKQGELFRFVTSRGMGQSVYVRGGYDRSRKKYEAQRWDDTSSFLYRSGNSLITTDFEF